MAQSETPRVQFRPLSAHIPQQLLQVCNLSNGRVLGEGEQSQQRLSVPWVNSNHFAEVLTRSFTLIARPKQPTSKTKTHGESGRRLVNGARNPRRHRLRQPLVGHCQTVDVWSVGSIIS